MEEEQSLDFDFHVVDEDSASGDRIARAASLQQARIDRHRFPDGELKLRLPPQLPERVVVLRTLDQPDEKLVELLLVGAPSSPAMIDEGQIDEGLIGAAHGERVG